MKGLTIKEIYTRHGFTQGQIAQMLGETQQNLSAALTSKDVKTGLVERIAAATGIPLGEFYGENFAAAGDNSIAINGPAKNVNVTQQAFLEEIAAQRRVTESVIEQNGKLLEIVGNLTK